MKANTQKSNGKTINKPGTFISLNNEKLVEVKNYLDKDKGIQVETLYNRLRNYYKAIEGNYNVATYLYLTDEYITQHAEELEEDTQKFKDSYTLLKDLIKLSYRNKRKQEELETAYGKSEDDRDYLDPKTPETKLTGDTKANIQDIKDKLTKDKYRYVLHQEKNNKVVLNQIRTTKTKTLIGYIERYISKSTKYTYRLETNKITIKVENEKGVGSITIYSTSQKQKKGSK